MQYLTSLFSEKVALKLVRKFHIGTSSYWKGATIFWQLDKNGEVRTGKIMLYNPVTGKRVRKPFNHVHWVHALLQKRGQLQDFKLRQCLFGEHQLLQAPAEQLIAIVESEKTAILMTALLPQYLWLACGSVQNLWPELLETLLGRKLVLYPDLGAYELWKDKAAKLAAAGHSLHISDLLEQYATAEERKEGLDLADYLIRRDPAFGWALNDENYPLFWDG